MKILMFGRGVIATIYGWVLQQAGHDVEFYVRPGRAATYGDAVDLDLFDMRRRVWGRRVAEKWPVRFHGALLPSVVFGTLDQPPTDRERAVRQAFREAGLRIKERPDFRGWLWVHFASDAGMFAQGLRVGSLSQLAGATGDLREALLAGRELLPLLQARGLDLRRHRGGVLPFRTPTWLTAPVLAWLTAHVAPARVSLTAHSDPDAEEPREVCRDTLAEARRLGIPVPRLEAAEPHFARV
ncbi:ketopantoate reductase [Nonomuraea sp. NPDC001636]|uniref:ketopantoate reductase family protein n=1 Tax=Nonomuraea sp. NPDC001636 TaxID=3154391 RepID=UPI00331BE747